MGLRNLYFGRLLVIKAFWNSETNDFDFKALDPRMVRFGKYARNEENSEFAIEEISDNLCAVIARFPDKKEILMKKYGFSDENEMYIKNPDVKYKESWIQDYVIFTLDNIFLGKIKNPYWDWDGILITEEEEQAINTSYGDARREKMQAIKLDQTNRQAEKVDGENITDETNPTGGKYKPYMFNYFNHPRKPYIFATIFNNENMPIGRTDMITLAMDLQKGVNKRKMDIDENCELVNGIIKVDASVMGKSDAQRMRFETKGIIWGKGVATGVMRETGSPLPQMVFDDLNDSRSAIDNIMAATSAFRGEREGQETKAGRLALIQQSYLRLNELVQVVDYVSKEIFDWGMQLSKCRYTEHHYAKFMGREDAQEVVELIQDDFETGIEVNIIAGKTLPQDDEFKWEQAQNDVENGYISPIDYLRIAQYDDPKQLSKNAVLYKQNPAVATGLTPEEMPLPSTPGTLQPDQQAEMMKEGLPPIMPQ